jgi:hypothetical protein
VNKNQNFAFNALRPVWRKGGGPMRPLIALCAAAALVGCAGRTAAPISTTQAADPQLSCSQMLAEIQANDSRANTLAQQEKSASNANVAIGVVGAVLFWPALFALDTGDAEKVEMAAYKARNDHLNAILRERNCGAEFAARHTAAPVTAVVPATAPSSVATISPPVPESPRAAPRCTIGPCSAGDME